MQWMKRSLALLLSLLLPAVTLSAEQAHVVNSAGLVERMQSRFDGEQEMRESIRRVLSRPEVREVAGRFGLDLARAESAVGTLEGDELARTAAYAEAVQESLAGGATVIITTTTIIIILLVVILIIVATD